EARGAELGDRVAELSVAMRRAARRGRRELTDVGERRFHERRQWVERSERAPAGARPHRLPPTRRAEPANAELRILGGQTVRRTGGQEHRCDDRRPYRPTARPPDRRSHGTPNGNCFTRSEERRVGKACRCAWRRCTWKIR